MWVHLTNGKQSFNLLLHQQGNSRNRQAGGVESQQDFRKRLGEGDRAAALPGTGNKPQEPN